MPERPTLYRKRLIPSECICLKEDEIISRSNELITTKWHTIRPKKVLDHGSSCYLLNQGWKVSRFMDREDRLLYWYCDIIDYTWDKETDTYVFTDLLADVLIYPEGTVKVTDLCDIASAVEQKLITSEQLCRGMRCLDALLGDIYSGSLLPALEQYWP